MDIIKDFRNFTKDKVKSVSMSVLDDQIKQINNGHINPYVLEERTLNVTPLDIYSRMMYDRILFLSGNVDGAAMDTLTAQLLYLDSLDSRPISLYINSGGGECYSGMELIGVMDFIDSDVNTVVLGMAASMGAVIASNGTKGKRMALPYSRFMIHQPSSYHGWNTFKDSKINLEEMESVKNDLYEILSKNSGNSIEDIELMCDRDKWMKPDEAIAKGFLDSIIEPKSKKKIDEGKN